MTRQSRCGATLTRLAGTLGPALAMAFGWAGAVQAEKTAPCAPAAAQFQPMTINPQPWPVATIRPDRPRLYVDAARLQRLRARWNDPAYAPIVRLYRGKTDPLSLALSYLATGDAGACHRAAADALAERYSLAGSRRAGYGDDGALVFDWCHAALSAAEKTGLVQAIEKANRQREVALDKRFTWHEAHYLGLHAYLLGVLAVAGEPGASLRLAKGANVIQNYTEFANEVHGDGTYKTYAYQELYFVTPSVLWSIATGRDVVRANRYLLHRPDNLLRLLSADGSGFVAGPGDQAADGSGLLLKNQDPGALAPLMLADYLKDGLAQYVGELIRRKQGWSVSPDDPRWLALLFYDDRLKPVPPAAAHLPPVEAMPIGGMVKFRSGWEVGRPGAADISAWFYAGPETEHAEADAGHFTIWRGDDDLIVAGANYFGSPSRYKDRWGSLAFARNTMVFSPADARDPDRAGSQLTDLPAALSVAKYPVANRLIWYRNSIQDRASLVDFRDDGRVAAALGDATNAYDRRYVQRYRRTVIYVRPNVFVLRDRFSLAGIGRIRLLIHSRERPQVPGLKPVQGTADAGILEGQGNGATIRRGRSQATIRILSPAGVRIRAVGGPGYENYIDGADVDAAAEAQDWLMKPPARELAQRLARIRGQWRLEFETTPAAAKGEMLALISVGPRGSPPPTASIAEAGEVQTLSLGAGAAIRLPDTDGLQNAAPACAR